MIYTETFENNGKQYQRTWSDEFTLIQQPSGIEYFEAVDVLPTKWTYIESENKKESEREAYEQAWAEAHPVEMGYPSAYPTTVAEEVEP